MEGGRGRGCDGRTDRRELYRGFIPRDVVAWEQAADLSHEARQVGAYTYDESAFHRGCSSGPLRNQTPP
jgi:hypothetical protein